MTTLATRDTKHSIQPATRQAAIIQQRLDELGSTWHALAKALDLDPSYMSHVKAGRTRIANPDTLERTAFALDLDPDALYLAVDMIPADVERILLDHPDLLNAVRTAGQNLKQE